MPQGEGPIKFDVVKYSGNKCEYTIRVTAEVKPNYTEVKDIYFYFKLDTTLFTFKSSDPSIDPPVGNLYTWHIGDLTKDDPPATLDITLTYLGSDSKTGVCPFTEAYYSYKLPNGNVKYHDIKNPCTPFDVTPCDTPPGIPLTFALTSKSLTNCEYEFYLKVVAGTALTNLKASFTINTDLFDFISISPSADVTQDSLDPLRYTWNAGDFTPALFKTLTIKLQYHAGLPADTVSPFIGPIDYTVTYDGTNHSGSAPVDTQPVAACILCCDGCTGPLVSTPVTFESCVPVKTAEVTVTSKLEGLVLFVDLTINNVCPNRDLAVLVLVYAVTYDKDGNPIETLKTHRVVTLPASVTDPTEPIDCTTRTCKGMVFGLPETLCNTKEFNVKAIAHYYNSLPIPFCTCAH